MKTVDDAWKLAVRRELKARSWKQGDLADKIGVVPATITNLLKPGTSQTRLRNRVAEIFGWEIHDDEAPVVISKHELLRRKLDRAWPKMSDDEKAAVVTMIEGMTRNRQPANQ